MLLATFLKRSTIRLQEASQVNFITHSARLDVELLTCHALHKTRAWLLAWPDKVLTSSEQKAINKLIDRRLKGEPIAYIIGEKPFWSLTLKVSPATLIPRPESELLVEKVLATLGANKKYGLDLGTGTGAIALALASERPHWNLLGIDQKEEIVCLAKENAQLHHITNASFKKSHWFEKIQAEKFDFIVSNPPYIEQGDAHLTQGDVRFEPRSALTSGVDGLNDIRTLCAHAVSYLKMGGWLLLEHGYNQKQCVQALFKKHGFINITTSQDLSGKDRVTRGQYCDE